MFLRAAVLTVAVLSNFSAYAGGDAARGEALYESRCGACHSLDTDRIGPRHRGLIGRRAGSVPGFGYSEALTRSDLVWDGASLERWLTDPEATIPGQGMGFRISTAQDRADIIAFLERESAR